MDPNFGSGAALNYEGPTREVRAASTNRRGRSEEIQFHQEPLGQAPRPPAHGVLSPVPSINRSGLPPPSPASTCRLSPQGVGSIPQRPLTAPPPTCELERRPPPTLRRASLSGRRKPLR